ncbi:monocarboxylate transporter 13-like [Ylistrum balloti]|uniref:monocarboxylate transporter 13-like n=1 Tax=Ylistrum balloti TaxID=509963 RepID=UPI002905C716|nr:monocarboxylate transporter 13-like [Ylistrum balloti]
MKLTMCFGDEGDTKVSFSGGESNIHPKKKLNRIAMEGSSHIARMVQDEFAYGTTVTKFIRKDGVKAKDLQRGLTSFSVGTDMKTNSVDGGWGWAVAFSSFMTNVLIDGVCVTFGIFFPEFLRYFGESKAKTQMLSSIMVGTLSCVGPFVSALVNRYGCRLVSRCGTVIASIGVFLSSFSPNLDVMIIFYGILGGVGFGFLYVPPIVIIGEYFDKRRALATGIAVCGAGLGGLIFAPVNEFLLEKYAWRGTMWIMSAITLNSAVFSATFKPMKVGFDPNNKKIQNVQTDNDQQSSLNKSNSYLCCGDHNCLPTKEMFDFSLLKSPTMLMYGSSCILVMFGFFIPYNFLPAWATDVNLSSEEGVLLIVLMSASSTVSRVVIGYVTDKSWANTLIINNGALLIGGLSTFFVPFYTSFPILAIYAIVFGIVTATFICLRSVLMAELLGVHRLTSSFGLVGLSMGLSTFLGAPIAGALSDISGNYNITFYFGGVTLGLGGLICLPLRRISDLEKSRSIDSITSSA